MNSQTRNVTLGCLLHDVGKLVYRANAEAGNHRQAGYAFLKGIWTVPDAAPILDCVRWHHAADLRSAKPASGSLAYIANLADNISAAADRRALDGDEARFDRTLPLCPVFSHLNGEHPGFRLPCAMQDGTLRMPEKVGNGLSAGQYAGLLEHLRRELKALSPEDAWVNSLLSVLECDTGSVPASTCTGESPDISLYDHLKISAAAGACISEYCLDARITDFESALFRQEAAFRAKPVFLLYSADFSGIQKFIYTVSTSNALRTLRSRSFFLELAMEHYIDELLTACGVSRANLLYSGGGHCYILLPNTQGVKDGIGAWNLRFNEWLMEQFGTGLFLAHGWTECSADDLTNTPAEKAPYREIFRRVSAEISRHKLHRYSAKQILRLNNSKAEDDTRECRICGRSDKLVRDDAGRDICPWCRRFETLSRKIQLKDVYLVRCGARQDADLVLPTQDGDASFYLTDEASARRQLAEAEGILRVYTKNQPYAGLMYSTKIYVGDYAFSNSMEELADAAEGIRRLAVCRMDVDDLGQSFVSGYVRQEAGTIAEQQKFVTISRTSAFSRQMSLFFKCYINRILSGEFGGHPKLKVSIVYSGGDDVFLVGAWTEVLKAARLIRKAFYEFSCGALTISAGIGLFHDHYPIRVAALETAALEDEAKQQPGKNAVTLFETGGSHAYAWDDFEKLVLGAKYRALEDFFKNDETGRGTSFLYKLMTLIRQAQQTPGEKIPLARYAYVLARLAPKQNDPAYPAYKKFADKMYNWMLNAEDRKQLLTAIYIYVYTNRKRKEQ